MNSAGDSVRRQKRQRVQWRNGILILVILLFLTGYLFRLPLCNQLTQRVIAHEQASERRVPGTGFSVYRENVLRAPDPSWTIAEGIEGMLVPVGTTLARAPQGAVSGALEAARNRLYTAEDRWVVEHGADIIATFGRLAVSADQVWAGVADLKGITVEGAQTSWSDTPGVFADYRDLRRQLEGQLSAWYELQRGHEGLEPRAIQGGRLLAPTSGLVRTTFDGLESTLRWDAGLTASVTETLMQYAQGLTPGDYVASSFQGLGPAVKVVDATRVQGVLLFSSAAAVRFRVGDRIHIELADHPQIARGMVAEIGPWVEEHLAVRVTFEQAPPYFFERRTWDMEVIHTRSRWMELPASAVVFRRGVPGVYQWLQRPRWVPVTIEDIDEDSVRLTGLSQGTPVVVNPEWIYRLRISR